MKYNPCPTGACPKVPHDGVCGCPCHTQSKKEERTNKCTDPELESDCSGCTDLRDDPLGGTHQGCTKQHGHVGCDWHIRIVLDHSESREQMVKEVMDQARPNNSYEQNYSHSHCWDQEVPACGINKENHARCCLCPKVKSKDHIAQVGKMVSKEIGWAEEWAHKILNADTEHDAIEMLKLALATQKEGLKKKIEEEYIWTGDEKAESGTDSFVGGYNEAIDKALDLLEKAYNKIQ